ncbi:MAG TPA: hypothetical protein PK876_10895 [Elusimicrobiota bacterium]|nr:hypothetical protein [Elusimicrobiota bacterium]
MVGNGHPIPEFAMECSVARKKPGPEQIVMGHAVSQTMVGDFKKSGFQSLREDRCFFRELLIERDAGSVSFDPRTGDGHGEFCFEFIQGEKNIFPYGRGHFLIRPPFSKGFDGFEEKEIPREWEPDGSYRETGQSVSFMVFCGSADVIHSKDETFLLSRGGVVCH